MRIRDWSSDVCPSDLDTGAAPGHDLAEQVLPRWGEPLVDGRVEGEPAAAAGQGGHGGQHLAGFVRVELQELDVDAPLGQKLSAPRSAVASSSRARPPLATLFSTPFSHGLEVGKEACG